MSLIVLLIPNINLVYITLIEGMFKRKNGTQSSFFYNIPNGAAAQAAIKANK